MDVFATHGKIYEASASAMFGVPSRRSARQPGIELRQKGKNAELALGYQGASGALITMGALNMGLTEEDCLRSSTLASGEQAHRGSVVCDGERRAGSHAHGCPVGLKAHHRPDRDLETDTHFLTIQLPSGRKLYYDPPFLCVNDRGREALHYWGTNQTSKKWEPIPTYGGKLVENVVQAIARTAWRGAWPR
jgi:DNA polymerase